MKVVCIKRQRSYAGYTKGLNSLIVLTSESIVFFKNGFSHRENGVAVKSLTSNNGIYCFDGDFVGFKKEFSNKEWKNFVRLEKMKLFK